jgi:hypothetical protein
MTDPFDSPKTAALDYLSRGWAVVPIGRHSKRPIIAWQVYQQQLPDAADLEHWFARWPDANIAIVTGRHSGLDVDHGGEQSLDALIHERGPLPATMAARSGGGGRHLYFGHPGGVVHNRVDLFRGIDLRGDGGLIVAPPSVHPSGGRYRWLPGCAPEECSPAPLPEFLCAAIVTGKRAPGHPAAFWRELLATGVTEGGRNNAVASLTGHLLWHGVDHQVVTELLLCWNRIRCQPPLDDDEVERTVESIVRTHLRQQSEGGG